MRLKSSNQGFTLVELSIVLVIIGLIVASVLVGQDLIRQGELRSTVSQYEQYIAAAGTFKTKYAGLPGDVTGDNFFATAVDHDDNCIVGDGLFATGLFTTAVCTAHDTGSDNLIFWNQLGSAGAALISGNFDGSQVTTTAGDISSSAPQAKAGGNWAVYTSSGINYMIIGATDANTTAGRLTTANSLSPLDALSIDQKVDDGKPGRGVASARGAAANAPDTAAGIAASASPTTVGSTCTYETTGLVPANAAYNTVVTTDACTLRIRLSL